MSKHIVILGHGEGDPGATGYYGKSERAYLEDFARKLKEIINAHGLAGEIEVFDSLNVYRHNLLNTQKAKFKGNMVTELHLNSFNKNARGCEILFGAGLNPDALDNRIKDVLTRFWAWRKWLKTDNIQNCRVAKRNGINYRLVEFCFCDNQQDIDIFTRNLDAIAHLFVEALLNRKIGQVQPPITAPTGELYRVQVGAYKEKKNADLQLSLVKKHFPDAFITKGDLYRIQVGAFKHRKNAEMFLGTVKQKYKDAFITT